MNENIIKFPHSRMMSTAMEKALNGLEEYYSEETAEQILGDMWQPSMTRKPKVEYDLTRERYHALMDIAEEMQVLTSRIIDLAKQVKA